MSQLVTNQSISSYKRSVSQKQKQPNNENIFERLYKEKEKYDCIKDNSNREKYLIEKELELCTFSPTILPNKDKKRRNFDQVYRDLIEFKENSFKNYKVQKEIKEMKE